MLQRRKTGNEGRVEEVKWREWSRQAFQEAQLKGKLVLLDLTASWCHWCHVMDDTTYSDPTVARLINENFVPIRVDIDQRPDISDRYNRGGFPTTVFLSDRGEPVWGSTYIPPTDMIRITGSVLKVKASGEIDLALDKRRLQSRGIPKACSREGGMDAAAVDSLFEDIFSTYDIEFGGFGTQPKFPQPEVIELLLQRYSLDHDPELAEAVVRTLTRMADGLYDEVEGGVFRYSLTRDWRMPHYEKMLDTNIGYLRNLVHAHKLLGTQQFADLAFGTAKYLLSTLWDPDTGAFFGSQDADEEYYRLGVDARKRRTRPSIDRNVYAGWNAEASAVMVFSGALLNKTRWIEAGKSALDRELRRLWNPRRELVRHAENLDLYLFTDQADLLEALVANMQISLHKRLVEVAGSLVRGVERAFSTAQGGYSDIMRQEEAVGELTRPQEDLRSNSKWAMSLGLYSAIAHRQELLDKAWETLRSFSQEQVAAHGLFASGYIRAWWVLERGPVVVEVHSSQKDPLKEEMWRAVNELADPGAAVMPVNDLKEDDRPYAIACTPKGCSEKAHDPESLLRTLGAIWSCRV